MDLIEKAWKLGKEHEVSFWHTWIPNYYDRYAKPRKLREYFGELIGNKKEVSILDVGSGAVSTIGYTWDDVTVHITLSDILANEYNKLFEEYKIKPIIPIEYQDMSHLTYDDNTFDIVNCRNALDHTLDPIGAISEMIRVCKPGGWVYLAHFAREGKRSRYVGLHQWNIDESGDSDCLIWNRENKFLLSQHFPGFVTEIGRRADGLSVGVASKYHKRIDEKLD